MEKSSTIKFTEGDIFQFNVYASLQPVGPPSPPGSPKAVAGSSKTKNKVKRKKAADKKKKAKAECKIPEVLVGGTRAPPPPLLDITSKEIPALEGAETLRDLWLGIEAQTEGGFPGKNLLDKPLGELSLFEKLAGLYATAVMNITVREQLDYLGSFGGQRENMDRILASSADFEFLDHELQDNTQGRVYVLPDGGAYIRESYADPVFRPRKGDTKNRILADGSRAMEFPAILAVCMEGTGRPLGFIWSRDLQGIWQTQLGDHICDFISQGAAPDPQRFLQWKIGCSYPDVEYAEDCARLHPYLKEEDSFTARIIEGFYQQQTCEDILYTGLPSMGGWRLDDYRDGSPACPSREGSPQKEAGQEDSVSYDMMGQEASDSQISGTMAGQQNKEGKEKESSLPAEVVSEGKEVLAINEEQGPSPSGPVLPDYPIYEPISPESGDNGAEDQETSNAVKELEKEMAKESQPSTSVGRLLDDLARNSSPGVYHRDNDEAGGNKAIVTNLN